VKLKVFVTLARFHLLLGIIFLKQRLFLSETGADLLLCFSFTFQIFKKVGL